LSLTLDNGPHTVTIYLEERVTDTYGNEVKRPSTTAVTVTGCIVSPLSSSRGAFPALSVTQGQRVDNAYRFMARDAPLGWWSRVIWHHPDGRDRSMTVLGGPLKYATSPETTHVSATLHEES
jgi:hypothetical protein